LLVKKSSSVLLMVGGLLLTLALAFSACGGGGGDDAIVGVWTDEQGLVEYEFKSDGALVVTFMGQEDQTTYSTEDGLLMFPDPDTGEQSEIQYRVEGDRLIMTLDGEEGILVRKE
jgi:hypothetical protein